jgi:cytochrome o ubiquinol oxidase subunit II
MRAGIGTHLAAGADRLKVLRVTNARLQRPGVPEIHTDGAAATRAARRARLLPGAPVAAPRAPPATPPLPARIPVLPTTAAWSTGVLDPHGPIAAAERTILLNATVIMLAVIVPVILLTLAFAWWFRAGNRWARREPDWAYSGPVEVTVWSIPTLVVLFLGGIAWIGSHELDPARPIAARAAPLDVQVVSLDWKWLFIYPGAGVASVNRLVVPAGTPLRLQLTSASVMNSFFVPQLGSQIYTMAGMTTTLHLQADRAGTYPGLSAQFSGDGFSDMRFDAVALAPAAFADWLASARAQPGALDAPAYAALARPGVAASAVTYGRVAPGLFRTILADTAKASAPARAME